MGLIFVPDSCFRVLKWFGSGKVLFLGCCLLDLIRKGANNWVTLLFWFRLAIICCSCSGYGEDLDFLVVG